MHKKEVLKVLYEKGELVMNNKGSLKTSLTIILVTFALILGMISGVPNNVYAYSDYEYDGNEGSVPEFTSNSPDVYKGKKKDTQYSNEWISGKWYNSDGSQTYAGYGSWKNDSYGWWYEDSAGWYPKSMWQKIDGKYYYFNSTGYMDYNGYRDGYWLGSTGAWIEKYYGGHWCSNSKGWWYEDSTGWNPVNRYLWIDGTKYWFGSDGYWDNSDWALILVNKYNPVPDNYSVNLTTLSNGKKVDSRIYPALQDMFNAARSSGLDMYVREGYRTRAEQQQIMNSRIQQYQSEGYSYDQAVTLAKQYVAVPGTSEHELGICVDINANNNVSSDDAVYSWLDNNAYKYGFIKRYPENKSSITGINYEPWHYRYVGKKAAGEMKSWNMCLEEYLDYLSK